MRLAAVSLAWLLALAGSAHAQDTLDRAADTLRLDPVYVDPAAERAISDSEADDLRAQIGDEDTEPLYLAILPADAGNDPNAILAELTRAIGVPGTYAVLVGQEFRARATGGALPRGVAGGLAADARGADTVALLEDFVRGVGEARAGAEGGEGDDDGGFPVILVLLVAIPLVLFGLWKTRRRSDPEA